MCDCMDWFHYGTPAEPVNTWEGKKTKNNLKMVILGTNMAETGLTIPRRSLGAMFLAETSRVGTGNSGNKSRYYPIGSRSVPVASCLAVPCLTCPTGYVEKQPTMSSMALTIQAPNTVIVEPKGPDRDPCSKSQVNTCTAVF